MKEKLLHRLPALLLALILLAFCTGAALADDSDTVTYSGSVPMEAGSAEEYTTVTARYYEDLSGQMYDLDVRYSDEYFTRDPDVFYLDLAQATFGMTVSAFRTGTDEGAAADANIRSFYDQAGFENYESVWYDRDTTADSIATAMAEKQIGDTTVVAMICCGAGYGQEWLSNLTVGDGTEHEGFSAAAAIAEERLKDYMQRNGITGNVRLWIGGFSRASAVGNCLAARVMEEDIFDAVYGYFCATPNNTQDPVAYPNLFNIVGQNDPVAQIPLSVWGYGRNGVDIYTPAQESNSSYIQEAFLANPVCAAIAGQSFRNNPDLNRQLHVVFEYLGTIFPTPQDYATILQPKVLALYRQHSGQDLLEVLREALIGIADLPSDRQSAADALIRYLDELIYQYVSGNSYQKEDGSWNTSEPLTLNLVLEHVPSIYASWLFSTEDPNELFVNDTGTIRLVIEGKFTLEIWDEDGAVQKVTSDNQETVYLPGNIRPDGTDLIYLYANNHDGKAVVNIPQDRDYTIKLYMEKNDTVSLFSDGYSYTDKSNDVSDVIFFSTRKGQCIELSGFRSDSDIQVCTDDGQEVACMRQTLDSDTQSVLAMEQMMSRNISMVRVMVGLAGFVLLLPLVLLIGLIVFLALRKKHKLAARWSVTACFACVTLIFAAGAMKFSELLPTISLLPAIFAAVACLFIVINALHSHSLKVTGIAVLLEIAAFADYYLFCRESLLVLDGITLAVLVLAGLTLVVLAGRKNFAKTAEKKPAEN